MGRKSKLTDVQWAQIEQRLIAGEPRRQVARDFGISETSIREHFGKQQDTVPAVAKALVEAETSAQQAQARLEALPPLARISAQNLAARLRTISENLAGAAENGSATALRLTALANTEVQKIDDADPLKSVDALRGVAGLTKLANDSAAIGLNLLAANKDAVREINQPDDATRTITWDEFYGRAAKPQRGAAGSVLDNASPQ